ncbi:hypothetical protein WMF31_26010 [Sorangium sp. So ce1036]|uniref:hypothetical protein n=1 Tax=Sorangium sp. So ce1036 TaxID=3133328 RepID=UPI003F06CC27
MKPRLPGQRTSPAGDEAPPRRSGPDRGPRLVPVAPVAPEVEPDAPASDDELRAARALAEALERGEVPLAAALRAAARPSGLDLADHEALLARALGDEEAPPTKAEQRAAERLREALEGRAAEQGEPAREGGAGGEGALGQREELADLAIALRAAWRPRPLAELRGRALVEQALRASSGQRGRRTAPVTMAALSALAAVAAVAAGVALLVGEVREELPSAARAPAAPAAEGAPLPSPIAARSTAALFDPAAPFPREGGQTARIDRIAAARAADLRQNRYAAWGVR